jgi:putative flippase GtrA
MGEKSMRLLQVPKSPLLRWIVFNSVGAMGFIVQMSALYLMASLAGLHYLWATVLAVEAAILHNFLWHENWTWADRARSDRKGWRRRLVRFQLANGVVSVAGNALLMRYFVGALKIHVLPANLIAIALCAVINFAAGDRLVFRAAGNPS